MSEKLPKPQIRDFPTTYVVGLERRFERETLVDIGRMWTALREVAGEIENPTGTAAFGISQMRDRQTLTLDYIAGVEVSDLDHVPEGLVGREIGGGQAAFFPLKLTGGPIGEVIGGAMGAIWRVWMPASGFEATADYDIERYDYRFNPKSLTGYIELVVPVKPRS